VGRRLTPSERRQREREREQRAAARRAKTAARRSKEKQAREREKSRQKAAKEAKTEKEIQKNRKTQKTFDTYMENICSFHKNYKTEEFVTKFESRQKTREYKTKEFSQTKYKIKTFEGDKFNWKDYKPKKFKTKTNNKNQETEYKFKPIAVGLVWFVYYMVFGVFILPLFGFRSGSDETYYTAMVLAAIITALVEGVKFFRAKTNKKQNEEQEEKRLNKKQAHDKKEKEKQEKDKKEKEKAKQKHKEQQAKALEEHNKKEENKQKQSEEENKQKQEKHKEQEEKNKKKFDLNETKRKETLQKAKQGALEEIEMVIESVLPLEHKIETPENMPNESEINNTEVGYNVTNEKTIHIVYEIPDLDSIIPKHKYSITPKGTTLKISDMSERQTNSTKNNFVCSMAFHHTLEILRAYPFFEKVVFEAKYTGVETTTGKDKDITVLLVNIETNKMLKELNLDKIPEIEDAIVNFDYQFSKYGSKPKEIKSPINKEEIVWSTPNAEDTNIPYGLNPKERKK